MSCGEGECAFLVKSINVWLIYYYLSELPRMGNGVGMYMFLRWTKKDENASPQE